jgi:hypothetical protein
MFNSSNSVVDRPNKILKTSQLKPDEIVNEFMKKRESNVRSLDNSSILNSTAYTSCLNSLGGGLNTSNENSSIGFKEWKNYNSPKNLKERINHYTGTFNHNKHRRMDELENKKNFNLNLIKNYRYIDVRTNNHIINFLPKFKKIYFYNNKAQEFYSTGNIQINTERSKVTVLSKIEEYKKFLNSKK